MKGSKPRTPLRVIAGPGRKRSAYPCPAWLPAEARAEWNRAVQDLSGRGLMFDGALASLEHYVLCIAQIRQCCIVSWRLNPCCRRSRKWSRIVPM